MAGPSVFRYSLFQAILKGKSSDFEGNFVLCLWVARNLWRSYPEHCRSKGLALREIFKVSDMSSNRTIVWFRRDLRIEDNPALAAAARDGSILPVFIWCPNEEEQFHPGRVSRWWLKQSLVHLSQSLKSLGAELVLIKTHSTLAALRDCINAIGATKLVFNHLYGK